MARTIVEIKQSIVDKKNAEPSLSGLTSPSQAAIYNLIIYIVAACIFFHETLWDILKKEIEGIAEKAIPGTAKWWQDQIFKFQFSSTTPQVISLIDFYPKYAVQDPTLRIITRASIKQDGNKVIGIKVAKGIYPSISALSVDEKSALQNYVDKIKFAGTEVNITSLNADRLRIAAEVYYEGQFVQSVVKAAVIVAIDEFLATLPFDGVFYLNKLIDAIQNVDGVKDVVVSEAKGRADAQPLTSGIIINRFYETKAGYMISEDIAGNTLADTITMTLNVI